MSASSTYSLNWMLAGVAGDIWPSSFLHTK